MARLPDDEESRREVVEAALAQLGNSLVYLGMVSERVKQATRMAPAGLLEPALEDLDRSRRLIRGAQDQVVKMGTGFIAG